MKLWIGYVGALFGACIAYYVVQWGEDRFLDRGHYALLLLPGFLIGLMGTVCLRRRSFTFGLTCSLVALALTLFLCWKTMPFPADESLTYFVRNFDALVPMVQSLILGSAGAALILGWGLLSSSGSLEDDS